MTFDDLFALTAVGSDAARATDKLDHWTAPGAPPTDERMVFGGLVVGQAIVAASAGTRPCHALHAYFIGMGEKQKMFEIAVEHTRDGGSFSTRRVEIRQDERLLLAAYTSHHDGDEGPEHQVAMPQVPGPEGLEDFHESYRRYLAAQGKPSRNFLSEAMLEVRPVPPANGDPFAPQASQATWFKPRLPFAGGLAVHQAVIGFASDTGLVRAGMQRHARPGAGPYQNASLDHAIWFHAQSSANEWMLHVVDSPIATNGRGFARASIYDREGLLVASVAQEFMARISKPRAK